MIRPWHVAAATLAGCIAFTGATIGAPRLIGTGCEGRPLGIALARHAGDFLQPCDRIEPLPWIERTYRAVIEHADGSQWIVEHNATLSDCMAFLADHTPHNAPVSWCEPE